MDCLCFSLEATIRSRFLKGWRLEDPYLSLTFDEGCSIFNHDHGFILVVRLVYLLLHSPHLDINPLHSRMVWLWCYLCIGNCVQQQDISP